MQNQERVIDKIRKLLAVANNGATGNGVEHEQETAMRQALALLAKHNLSMTDVDVTEDKEDRDQIEIAEEFPCPWRRVIAGAVAGMFFCEFYSTHVPGKQKYKFNFVGLESNAVTAREMTQYLLKSVYQESMRRQKEQGQTVAFGTTFRNTAAARIAERCEAIRKEAEEANQAESTSNALALTSLYEQEAKANLDFIQKVMGVKLIERKVKSQYKSRAGLVQGDHYGKNVSLNRQLGAGVQRGLALGRS